MEDKQPILKQHYELGSILTQLELMELYLDTVMLNGNKGDKFQMKYFEEHGLESIYDNLVEVKEEVAKISDDLYTIFDERPL
ncbi:hypothetical protein TMUPMC115_2063 [Tetragenococcus muriaticus PMC-11-5]|uniref:Uncharacterized protein n=1 Tax=Tetragenococcus muriaticus PMC-11-5 TaxID=1302649 RepID=A0A091CCC8_9ENTE|nr:hypothetical protein [Tetragenococcus muriaticus]KFN90108.1 hypothetical protein TMUPMC115_2063 [Tetragenococcus muriaticus PMC-11-5]